MVKVEMAVGVDGEQLPATAAGEGQEAEDGDDEADVGTWGGLFVNLYYALVNLGIMLGSIGLLMVAYWLLKWATASGPTPRASLWFCACLFSAKFMRSSQPLPRHCPACFCACGCVWMSSFSGAAMQCRDCCCNSCNKGSSYCAFPRFNGEDIGDETRNFIFWMAAAGLLNFCLSYSLWANYGSPRCEPLPSPLLLVSAVFRSK